MRCYCSRDRSLSKNIVAIQSWSLSSIIASTVDLNILSFFQALTLLRAIWSSGVESSSWCSIQYSWYLRTSLIQDGIWWRWTTWVMEWSYCSMTAQSACLLRTYLPWIWNPIASITFHSQGMSIDPLTMATFLANGIHHMYITNRLQVHYIFLFSCFLHHGILLFF